MASTSLVAAFLVVIMFASTSHGGYKRLLKARKNKQRPNIVFILTDDLDSELGSMRVMNKTRTLVQQEGAEFVNAYVTTPMCCPSRSSILTGMYVHNHNVLTNNINCSSMSWRKGPERRNYGRFISEAGYNTGYFGKYLNEYDGTWIPPGWREWMGLIRNSKFYNYTLRRNRAFEKHGASYHRDYLTDLITNNSISFFRRSKKKRPNQPVLMVLSMPAPHGPEDAAPQYKDMFANITSPRTPNWNVHSSDKHWILRQSSPLTPQKIAYTDLLHRKRLLTLLSVDDAVERVVRMIQDMKLENNTYLIFTSDHGYHLGQYRLIKGKSMPYEMDIKVPFYIRGPGIPRNIKMNDIVLNIDLAPTMLDIAGVRPPRTMDGLSIMKLFRRMTRKRPKSKKRFPLIWRDTFLVQRGKMTRATWKNLSTERKIPGSKKESKRTWRKRQGVCTRSKYRPPCKPGQTWECVKVAGRNRLRKCKKRSQPTPTPVQKKCICYRLKSPLDKPDPRANKLRRVGDSTGWQDDFQSSRRKRSPRTKSKGRRKTFSNPKVPYKRYQKELRRAALKFKQSRLQALKYTKSSSSERDAFTNDLEYRLVKLNGKIAGIKLKLQQMRDRKKRLMRIHLQTLSYREKFEPFPCECVSLKSKHTKQERTRKKRQDVEESRPYLKSKKWNRNVSKSKKSRRIDEFNAQLQRLIKANNARKKGKRRKAKKCAQVGMTCFHHTEKHWKTEPRWTKGEFCACPNAANNTYHCLRTINVTHNFLYCEFVTDFREYFDLNRDPYELDNIVDTISPDVLDELHNLLERMKGCRGTRECSHYHGKNYSSSSKAITTNTQTPIITTTSNSSLPLLNNTTPEPIVTIATTVQVSTRLSRRERRKKRLRRPTKSGTKLSSNKKTTEKEHNLQEGFTTAIPSHERRPTLNKGKTQPLKQKKRKRTRLNKKRKSKLRRKKLNRKRGSKTSEKKGPVVFPESGSGNWTAVNQTTQRP